MWWESSPESSGQMQPLQVAWEKAVQLFWHLVQAIANRFKGAFQSSKLESEIRHQAHATLVFCNMIIDCQYS